jgi:hypothetical protein
MNRRLFLALAFAAGCVGEKAPVDDNFSDLAGADEKSDKFTGKMTIVGSIEYGQSQGPFTHKAGKWSALKFAGDAGDAITVDVKSTNGDTVAWVLDNDMNIVAFNDDYGAGTNSHIDVTLPKNASRTHYIVTRDYYKGGMKFTVSLKGKKAVVAFDTPCTVDADCERVRPDCCKLQDWISVRADQVDAYRASLMCPDHLICPAVAVRENHAVAECKENKCVAVLPANIDCGGHTRNMHQCPDQYTCEGPQLAVDGTGKCYKFCGGIAGFACDQPDDLCLDNPNDDCDPNNGGADCGGECRPARCSTTSLTAPVGYHWDQWVCGFVENTSCGGFGGFPCAPGKSCIDAPDSCDPAHGGADCPGICVASTDCRVAGCANGQFCSFCWGSYACIPNGALC